MADKLSALVTCNNDLAAAINEFNNTFELQTKAIKQRITAIVDKVIADGEYASFAAAKNDIANQMSAGNSTIANQTFAQRTALQTDLNAYNFADPVATRAAAVEAIMIKIEQIAPLVARV